MSFAASTSFAFVGGHPERPLMTLGQRFHSFRLACPDVIISRDRKSATWEDEAGPHYKTLETPGALISYLEREFLTRTATAEPSKETP